MDTTTIILFAGFAALIIFTQVGRHTVNLYRFILPMISLTVVSLTYLKGIPTAGGELDFEVIMALVGVALGLLAAVLVRVERDATTGKIVTQAGVAYAALWVFAFGGRILFAELAQSVWKNQVAQFSINHAITSSNAWVAAFILMAIGMVLARTVVVGTRVLLAARSATPLLVQA